MNLNVAYNNLQMGQRLYLVWFEEQCTYVSSLPRITVCRKKKGYKTISLYFLKKQVL